jgi:hypothetical protein
LYKVIIVVKNKIITIVIIIILIDDYDTFPSPFPPFPLPVIFVYVLINNNKVVDYVDASDMLCFDCFSKKNERAVSLTRCPPRNQPFPAVD